VAESLSLLHSIPWFAWIPIVAIVGGITSGTITKLVELRHRHTERMTMIRAGMHPDIPAQTASDPGACKPAAYQEL